MLHNCKFNTCKDVFFLRTSASAMALASPIALPMYDKSIFCNDKLILKAIHHTICPLNEKSQ